MNSLLQTVVALFAISGLSMLSSLIARGVALLDRFDTQENIPACLAA